jgi:hypothetical protein
MPLDYQSIDVPLAGGLDTRTDPKLLPPVKCIDLQNAVFSKTGTLQKANGYTLLGDTTLAVSPATISSAKLISSRGTELLQCDADTLYSYADTADAWVDKGTMVSFHQTVDTVTDATTEQTLADMATADGVSVYAWEDSRGGVYYAAHDATSGAELLAESQLTASGVRPRVVAINNTLHIFYIDSSNIKVKRLVPADLAATDDDAVIDLGYSDVHGSPHYDVVSTGSVAVWAYRTSATKTRIGYWVDTGALGSPGNGYAIPIEYNSDCPGCLSVAVRDDGEILIGLGKTSGGTGDGFLSVYFTSGLVYDGDFSGSVGVDPVACAVVWDSSDAAHIFFEVSAAASYNRFIKHDSSTGSETVVLRHAGLGSSAFAHDDEVYVHAVHDSTLQGTYFCINSSGSPVGRVLAGTANGLPANGHLPRVSSPSTDEWEWAAIFKTRLSALDDSVYTQPGIKHIKYDFDSQHAYSSAQRDEVLYLGGGLLWEYDGISPVENGFLLYPENCTATAATGSGSMESSCAYSYRIYYGWTNAFGQRVLSTTAEVVSVTMGAGDNEVDLVLQTLDATWKQGDRTDVALYIYRTKADGSTYHLATSLDPTTSGDPANGYLENDPTSDTLSWKDRLDDDDLELNELDYLNSGELDNVAPPALRGLLEGQDRLWGVSAENRRRVYYSKLRKDLTPAEFNDGLYTDFPDGVVSLAEVNGQIVAFSDSAIYLLVGEGPNNLGYGDYGRPQLITNDVGVKDPRTLVETPDGWIFQSTKGFRLLTKQLQVVYIGSDVQIYNDQTFTAATLLAEVNQVRFLTSSGRTLVFDYERAIWSTLTRHEGVSATLWGDSYCYIDSDGKVHQETAGKWTHGDGNAVVRVVETAWIKPSTLQGYGRARRVSVLGNYISPHKLKVEVAYNYESFYRDEFTLDSADFIETATWGADANWGAGNYWGGSGNTQVYQARHRLGRQKCTAVKFRLTEIPDTTPGEGFELNALGLEIGFKQGSSRLAANRTY